jgi:hypothetical protein
MIPWHIAGLLVRRGCSGTAEGPVDILLRFSDNAPYTTSMNEFIICSAFT